MTKTFDTPKARIWLILLGALFILCIYFLGFYPSQKDFPLITTGFGISFAIYFFILKSPINTKELNWLIGFCILARFVLVFAFPNFSDDIYRFIWDGHLINNGLNPFEHLPKDALSQSLNGITKDLYEELNSQDYYTIYPPISQLTFFASTFFSDDWHHSSIIMKSFLFLFEIGSIFCLIKILEQLSLPKKNVLIYALNPLIIVEIMGNLHFEGAMIFFLLVAYYLLLKNKLTLSGIAFGLAVCSKLLPLLFLPSLFQKINFKKLIIYYVVVGLTILICFLPLLSQTFIANFADSLDLYFRKFEFNASVYYLWRSIGKFISGHNLILYFGPILGVISLSIILGIAYSKRALELARWPEVLLFTITSYLLLTTTVHPWYLSLPIVLCCMTSYRYPLIWSALICLTYINYSTEVYSENLWVVGVEYVVIFGVLVWEVWFGKKGLGMSSR